MLAIAFKFVAGRYHATKWDRNVNEGVPEWPPSPWRIIRAIIATWKRKHPDLIDVWPILQTLAKHDVEFSLPPATQSHTRHFVPIGDKSTKIIDSFVVIPPTEKVIGVWKEVNLDKEQKKILDIIIRSIPYLGRAESWCQMEIIDNHPNTNCVPVNENSIVLNDNYILSDTLAPTKDVTLEQLCIETNDSIRYEIPCGSQLVPYMFPIDNNRVHTENIQNYTQNTDVTVFRYRVYSPMDLKVYRSLNIGVSIRRAAMSKYGERNDKRMSTMLSGKDEKGNKLTSNHKHAYFYPTDEDNDGLIDHVTIVAREPFTRKDVDALLAINEVRGGYHKFKLIIQGFGKAEDFRDVPIMKKSKVWVSLTPLVLSRHPKIRHGKCIKDGPEDQIRREIALRYSNNVKIKSVDVSDGLSTMINNLRPIQFIRWRKDGLAGFGAFSIRIEFFTNVAGPISLGHGSHFGLGMLVPLS